MKTYVTADLHFGHRRIIEFCEHNRGHFTDVEHMNAEMIRMWNEIVNPEDTTYILGDVAFMSGYDAALVMMQLNGRKILVEGNHDRKTLKDINFRNQFAEIHTYLEMQYNNTHLVLFHFPINEWNQMFRGAVHLHGHTHGKVTGLEEFRVRDAGWDATGQIVTLMDDLIADAMKGKIKTHHPEIKHV